MTLTINIGDVSGNPGPTDTSGNIKVIVGGTPVTQSDDFYDKTATFEWWITAALSSGSGAAGEGALVAALKANAGTYHVTFSGTNLKFGTTAAVAIKNENIDAPAEGAGTVKGVFVIDGNGAIDVNASNHATHYVGVTDAQTTQNEAKTISGDIDEIAGS